MKPGPLVITRNWFPFYPIELLDQPTRWRQQAKTLQLSAEAKTRLEWFIFYETAGERNAARTCRHFGITRRKFYFWNARFDRQNLLTLEAVSSTPHTKREREITPTEEQRIIALRRAHMHWGKLKLAVLYRKTYGTPVSSWKIQKTIEAFRLYPNPQKNHRTQQKRQKAQAKKRITELKTTRPKLGFLLHFDTIELLRNGVRRYILTGIDHFTKLAFARMYATKSSLSAEDFLKRMYLLLDGGIVNVHQDNGCEFQKHFRTLCQQLDLTQYHSRPRTPKDNPSNERFNRTLQEEWLRDGHYTSDIPVFNRRLGQFLYEYNAIRPHQSLGHLTPLEFAVQKKQVSQRYPSSTVP